ncbi:hypothetical protein IAG41_15685 [Sphingomonas sp. JC676]|nr:hypothetical protein [Sphingomonas sp. JC676]
MIERGTIEGRDVCVARDRLAVIGLSGERTTVVGAHSLADQFRARGWEVLFCRFDLEHLHLDTLFCMLDANTALAWVEALPPEFLASLELRGIRILPARVEEARQLGCNILSLAGRTILVAQGQERLIAMLEAAGFETVPVDTTGAAARRASFDDAPLANPG